MTLSEFKSAYGLTTIDMYQSKSSKRMVADFHHNGTKYRIVTKEEFDPSKPIFVYDNRVDDIDPDTGEVVGKSTLFTFSNKTATPALTL